MSERADSIRKLAGTLYADLVRRDESAFSLLSHRNPDVRGAALLEFSKVCPSPLTGMFTDKCQEIAGSDPDMSNRALAIGAIGNIHTGSKDAVISRFLADLVISSAIPISVRVMAYWALREVQFGFDVHVIMQTAVTLQRISDDQSSMQGSVVSLAATQSVGSLDFVDIGFVKKYASPGNAS